MGQNRVVPDKRFEEDSLCIIFFDKIYGDAFRADDIFDIQNNIQKTGYIVCGVEFFQDMFNLLFFIFKLNVFCLKRDPLFQAR